MKRKTMIGFISVILIILATNKCASIFGSEADKIPPYEEVVERGLKLTKEGGVKVGNNINPVTKKPFTLYEITILAAKGAEGFRPTWYKDGKHRAIGFGFNDCGLSERRSKAAKYMTGGKMHYLPASRLLDDYIVKLKTDKKVTGFKKGMTDWQRLAVLLHCYNCGSVQDNLGSCCNSSRGCGRNLQSHNERRAFETALWKGDSTTVFNKLKKYQKKVSQMERDAKKKKLYE